VLNVNKHRWVVVLMGLFSPLLLGAGGKPAMAPEFDSARSPSLPSVSAQQPSSPWLNSGPLSMQALRGKVVLVEFWTFGCRNCQNVEPHIRQWYANYKDNGLVVIGVHTPEMAYERRLDRLREYVGKHGIDYPVVVDNDAAIWHAYRNWAWPTIYLVGKQGQIRYRHVGEGAYQETERTIHTLLDE